MGSLILLAAVSFVAALLLTPLSRELFRRAGVLDRPNVPRKRQVCPIPRAGGPAIVLSVLIAYLVIAFFDTPAAALVRKSLPFVWELCPAGALMFLVGLADDIFDLRPGVKFAGQAMAATLAASAGVRIHIVFGYELNDATGFLLTVFWLVGCANAFNLIDGVDGLAGSVGFFASLTTLVAALITKDFGLALATVPLVGGLLGFLRFNFYPASVYLGDSGSLLIGFLLGNYAVAWSQKAATALGMLAPLMVLSIPLFDTTASIIRRWASGRSLFSGDRGHLHHRLLDRGLTPRRVTDILCAACAAAAVFGVLQSTVYGLEGLILIVFCALGAAGIYFAGYVELDLIRALSLHDLRRLVRTEMELAHLARNARKSDLPDVVRLLEEAARATGGQLRSARWHGVSVDSPARAAEVDIRLSFVLSDTDEIEFCYPEAAVPVVTGSLQQLLREAHARTRPACASGAAVRGAAGC